MREKVVRKVADDLESPIKTPTIGKNRRMGVGTANLRVSYGRNLQQGLDLPGKSMLGSYLRKSREQQALKES